MGGWEVEKKGDWRRGRNKLPADLQGRKVAKSQESRPLGGRRSKGTLRVHASIPQSPLLTALTAWPALCAAATATTTASTGSAAGSTSLGPLACASLPRQVRLASRSRRTFWPMGGVRACRTYLPLPHSHTQSRLARTHTTHTTSSLSLSLTPSPTPNTNSLPVPAPASAPALTLLRAVRLPTTPFIVPVAWVLFHVLRTLPFAFDTFDNKLIRPIFCQLPLLAPCD